MKFEEFLVKDEPEKEQAVDADHAEETVEEAVEETVVPEDIAVQKAVVESLAAEKAEQEEKISELTAENERLKKDMLKLRSEMSSLRLKLIDAGDMMALKNEVVKLRAKCAEQIAALEKVGDVLSKNADTPFSNKVSLLDRDMDIPDRFPSETREHVLEVIAEAQKKAESEGCHRRAQLLEGVLMANEPEGTLAEKRAQLEKIFAANGNIVSGPVIEELNKLGISHKNGEEYLLPSEIIKRTY